LRFEKIAEEEKRLMRLAKLQIEKTTEYIKEKCKLSTELSELNTELYYINKKKQGGISI